MEVVTDYKVRRGSPSVKFVHHQRQRVELKYVSAEPVPHSGAGPVMRCVYSKSVNVQQVVIGDPHIKVIF